jgi:hypothetical protein
LSNLQIQLAFNNLLVYTFETLPLRHPYPGALKKTPAKKMPKLNTRREMVGKPQIALGFLVGLFILEH